MGNTMCRIILAPAVPPAALQSLGQQLRSQVRQPVTLLLCDLIGTRVRVSEAVAARAAEVRLIDIEPSLSFEVLRAASDAALGDGAYCLRIADDEGRDEKFPSSDWLKQFYPAHDLAWLLEPQEKPVSWNTTAAYVCPGNPASWGLQVPMMLALLDVATPGVARRCPMCRTEYVSRGEKGQCPSCSFVAWPFRDQKQARYIQSVPLDAFAWGTCTRCRRSKAFHHVVEQCFRCGQLLAGGSKRHAVNLHDNRDEIAALLVL